MPSSSFITDIVKRHVALPINKDLAALKVVLRDWVTYTEHVPLQQKPTHTAELHVKVQREAPSSVSEKVALDESAEAGEDRYLSRFFPKTRRARHGAGPSSSSSSGPHRPHVHRKVVPLALWSAVLPWEVQRGLSLSTLTLPTGYATDNDVPATAASTTEDARVRGAREAAAAQTQEVDEEEVDTLGVVSAPSGPTAASPRPTPGMLFVMDAKSVGQHGGRICFWSGAITQPIDVLFVAPVFAASVAPATSFGQLRDRRQRDRETDLYDLPEVQARFFPHGEMQPNTTAQLRVANFGHLDPFPHMLPAAARASEHGEHGEESDASTHTVEAATPEARYVMETVRHTLQHGVQAALAESRVAYKAAYAVEAPEHGHKGDKGVEIELTVELSDAMRRDVEEKARLVVQYVQPLEEVIRYHAQRLNTPVHSSAEETPAQYDDGEGGDAANGERKVRVWLSETESLWMTRGELAAHQARHAREAKETPQQAQRRRDREENVDAEADADERAYEAAEEQEEQEEEAVMEEVTVMATHTGMESATAAATTTTTINASMPTSAGASSLTPAEARQRSIAQQSPMLQAEDEGRPLRLAPSFTGRQSSSTTRSPGLVVSANKLARYPETRSDMPVLPPIDYDLLDLVVRLGVGAESVLFHYHPRILREWRHELGALNQLARRRRDPASDARAEKHEKLDDKDVMILLRLVRDPTLQLPEDLIALVEAVADLKEQLHGTKLG